MTQKTFQYLHAAPRLARLVGEPTAVQVTIIGTYPSLAAFTRAMVDAGLTTVSTSTVRRFGGETRNETYVAATRDQPGVLFAFPHTVSAPQVATPVSQLLG